MARVELRGVTKRYGATEVVHEVDLDIAHGEFVVFVGPSGCGKSTLLRMICGLEPVSGGEVLIDGKSMRGVPPAKRGVAMVFQSYALYPHMNVAANMGFSLRMSGVPARERDVLVRRAAAILQLEHLLERLPKELSGGQRQRVAIGRAIVRQPGVFLFDEPLSNLDAELRVQMRLELTKLHRQLGTTMIFVTHDQVEAMTLADRIVVLREGKVEQIGSPVELYQRPGNRFVAGFIGSPTMNLVEAAVTGDKLEFGSHRLPVPPGTALEAYNGRTVILGIRPSDFEDADVWRDERLPVIEVTADVVEDLGTEAHVLFSVDAPPVQVEGVDEDPEAGAPIPLVAAEGTSVFTAAVDARTAARIGSTVRLSVNPARFHFFDRDSGRVIRSRPQPAVSS